VRVLLLVDQLGGGGAERVVVDTATHLPSHCEVVVCATRAAGNFAYADELHESGVPLVRLYRSSRYDVEGLLRLRGLVAAYKPHVVHAHMFGSNVWARLLRLTARIPVVVCHEHTWSYDRRNKARIVVDRALSPLADAIIAVSEADRQKLIEVEGLPPNKVRVVYNGIDFARLDRRRPSHGGGAEWGPRQGEAVLLAVGKLQEQKGYPVLLRALALVLKQVPSTRLLIAGEGPLQSKLEMLAAELGVADKVSFLGFVRDVGSLLLAADVFVMASYFEGHPIALLEAMAAARPVVATSVGGVPEIVRQGETGLLVPPNDPHALAEAIVASVCDPALRRRLGLSAAEDVRRRFSIEGAIGRYVALYEELLSRRGGESAWG